jgi:hypothetical protein
MKVYRGRRSIAPLICNIDTTLRWVVSFISEFLFSWRRAPATCWVGGWVDPRASLHSLDKKSCAAWESSCDSLDVQSLAWSLYWVWYSGCWFKWMSEKCSENWRTELKWLRVDYGVTIVWSQWWSIRFDIRKCLCQLTTCLLFEKDSVLMD